MIEQNSKISPVVNEVKQPVGRRLVVFSLVLFASTGFSIEVEASDFKVKILKQQSPVTEVIDLLSNLFN